MQQVAEIGDIRSQFAIPDDVPAINLPARWNGPPGEDYAVVRRNPNTGRRSLDLLRWGLVPSWAVAGKVSFSTFNAQSETIAEKPAFRDAWRRGQRCVVPMDAFYEWRDLGRGRKQPYAISRRDGTMLAVGGLWDLVKLADGTVLRSFTIVTTPANALLAPLHHRMPLILAPADVADWLGETAATPERIAALLKPCPEDWLTLSPVDPRVSNVRNQDPEACRTIPEVPAPETQAAEIPADSLL
jgi:putative SOS response-associated peptidase YedK